MWIKIKDDRGKRVALSLSASIYIRRDRAFARALRANQIAPMNPPRDRVTFRDALRLLVWLVGSGLWVHLWMRLILWLFSSKGGPSIVEQTMKQLEQRASSTVAMCLFATAAFVVGLCIFLPPQVAAMHLWGPRIAGIRQRRHLLLRRCPTCDYLLSEVGPAADGCTVCPECGAAWKMPEGAINNRLPVVSGS